MVKEKTKEVKAKKAKPKKSKRGTYILCAVTEVTEAKNLSLKGAIVHAVDFAERRKAQHAVIIEKRGKKRGRVLYDVEGRIDEFCDNYMKAVEELDRQEGKKPDFKKIIAQQLPKR